MNIIFVNIFLLRKRYTLNGKLHTVITSAEHTRHIESQAADLFKRQTETVVYNYEIYWPSVCDCITWLLS